MKMAPICLYQHSESNDMQHYQSMKRARLIQRINDPVQSERIWTGPDSDIGWPMDYGLDWIIQYFLTCSRNKLDKVHQTENTLLLVITNPKSKVPFVETDRMIPNLTLKGRD